MAIAVHPFVTGQPHRIGALDAALENTCSHAGVYLTGIGLWVGDHQVRGDAGEHGLDVGRHRAIAGQQPYGPTQTGLWREVGIYAKDIDRTGADHQATDRRTPPTSDWQTG